ncbi:hexokinase-10-like isoform X1 [Phragmites australis]|uniref:hexokinase-10-like isoform X1 n=1 Tax=Phragmites australis TaxID=29695 RepID=UPI002D7A3F12|nr:hexokinase-10-like isoform X1 [Phragmites australis]
MGRAQLLRAAVGCAAAVTCAAATALVARRAMARWRWSRAVAVVRGFEEGCATPTERLQRVVNSLAIEMFAGLASEGASKVRMLLTCVDELPNGNEEGIYYAIDLGGTGFRVMKLELGSGSMVINKKVEHRPIPEELTKGTSEDLFNLIALALKNFIEREGGKDEGRALGFTFSFPVRQISISSGSLIRWTKEFSIEEAVGKDVAQCLNEALVRNGLNLQVTALVNNAVGTLALGHYYDEDTVAAVIIGAGINASYIERSVAITKCCGLLTNSGDMVVNVEWGSFRPPQIPLTPYDICFNDGTHNYYDQAFEKMISGVYLGEITRLVLQRMAQESDVFGSAVNCLSTPFILSTPCLAAIREDDSPDLKEVGRVLEEHLKIQNVPLKTRRLVMRICDIVTRRAARLAAAGIVAVLQKIGRDGTLCGTTEVRRIRGETKRSVVAIEGGLYQGYSVFREYLNEAIGEILGDEVASTVSLRVVEEGSGIGAALLAASYSSTRQNSA